MEIRPASTGDETNLRDLYLATFEEEERDVVARLAIELLRDSSEPPVLSLVAEEGRRLLGHIAFSPVRLASDGSTIGSILAPLAVHPDHQRAGIGSELLREGVKRLADGSPGAIFVYGDPGYYGRFGFSAAEAARFEPPFPLDYPFGWQVLPPESGTVEAPGGLISCVEALCRRELW